MRLTIVLRTEVADEATAQPYINYVKTQIEPHPEISMTAGVTKTLEPPPVPPG